MLSEGITEVLKEASKGKELEDILKEMALNEILKNTRLSARGKEVTYDMNPNLSIYNNPMETGIRFEKRFADGGIASAIGEIQKRKDGSDAMGEGGIGNLLAGEGGLLFDTSSPGTMAADAGILALTVFPPAAIAARLIQAGYKGAKLTKAMNQVKKVQEAIPKTGLGLKGSGRGSTFMQLTIPKEIAGVANMADGGAAEKEEDKDKAGTYKKETIIKDIINILSNTPKAIAKVISPDISKDAVIPSVPDVVKDVIKSRYINEVSDVENKPEEIVPQIVSQIDEEEVLDDSVKKEVKGRFDFLKDMDPALARALIAGGSAMLRPTEGPVRSFLSLGEFGGAFADSLSKSDAAKTDLERLYATVVAQTPEGEEPPTVQEFLLSQKGGSENLTFLESQQNEGYLLGALEKQFGSEDIEDYVVATKDASGKDIYTPLIEAVKEARTNDDFQNIYRKTILNPSAKKEKSGGFLSTLFGD